jgi:hypothetical protein
MSDLQIASVVVFLYGEVPHVARPMQSVPSRACRDFELTLASARPTEEVHLHPGQGLRKRASDYNWSRIVSRMTSGYESVCG